MDVADALRAALTTFELVEEEPADVRQAARAYVRDQGGIATVTLRELGYKANTIRSLLTPKGALRAGKIPRDAYKRYRSKRRSVERWITSGAETRRTPPAFVSKLRTRRRRAVIDRNLVARLKAAGIVARIRGLIIISQDRRRRLIPRPPSPGVTLGAPTYPSDDAGTKPLKRAARAVLDPFLAGEDEEAAEAFLDAFMRTYGVPELGIDDVTAIALWPADEEEPNLGELEEEAS